MTKRTDEHTHDTVSEEKHRSFGSNPFVSLFLIGLFSSEERKEKKKKQQHSAPSPPSVNFSSFFTSISSHMLYGVTGFRFRMDAVESTIDGSVERNRLSFRYFDDSLNDLILFAGAKGNRNSSKSSSFTVKTTMTTRKERKDVFFYDICCTSFDEMNRLRSRRLSTISLAMRVRRST